MRKSFNDLPAEVHVIISEYLSCADAKCLSLVCQQLRNDYRFRIYWTISLLDTSEEIHQKNPGNTTNMEFEQESNGKIEDDQEEESDNEISNDGVNNENDEPKDESDEEHDNLNKVKKAHDESNNMRYLNYEKTWIPLYVFTSPDRYSWFPTHFVKNVEIHNSYMCFQNDIFHQNILLNYPFLDSFRMKNSNMFVAESSILSDYWIDYSTQWEMATISFDNLMPYLRTLNNDLPAPTVFTLNQNSAFYKNHFEEYIPEKEDLIARFQALATTESTMGPNSSEYYDEGTIMEKEEKEFRVLKDESLRDILKNPHDLHYFLQNPQLQVFPRPDWTNFLTFLRVDIETGLGAPAIPELTELSTYPSFTEFPACERNNSRFPTFVPPKKYNFFEFDNYPSLKKLEISDKGEEALAFYETIYKSISKCKQLEELTIFISFRMKDKTRLPRIIQLINAIRGKWKMFALKLYMPKDQIIFQINNPEITHFQCSINSPDKDHSIYKLNPLVLKSLTLDFTTAATCIPQSLTLLSTSQETLEELRFNIFYSPHFRYVMESFNQFFSRTTFSNLKRFVFYVECDPKVYESVTFKLNKSNESIATFFSDSSFEQPIKTIGDAVKVFRQLQKKFSDFSEKHIQSLGITFLSVFLNCYNHGANETKPCCRTVINPFDLPLYHIFFAYNFGYLATKAYQGLFHKEYFSYSLQAMSADYIFYLLYEKTFPKLKSLHVSPCIAPSHLIMMPHFQQFCKSHQNIDITLSYSTMSDREISDFNKFENIPKHFQNPTTRGFVPQTKNSYGQELFLLQFISTSSPQLEKPKYEHPARAQFLSKLYSTFEEFRKKNLSFQENDSTFHMRYENYIPNNLVKLSNHSKLFSQTLDSILDLQISDFYSIFNHDETKKYLSIHLFPPILDKLNLELGYKTESLLLKIVSNILESCFNMGTDEMSIIEYICLNRRSQLDEEMSPYKPSFVLDGGFCYDVDNRWKLATPVAYKSYFQLTDEMIKGFEDLASRCLEDGKSLLDECFALFETKEKSDSYESLVFDLFWTIIECYNCMLEHELYYLYLTNGERFIILYRNPSDLLGLEYFIVPTFNEYAKLCRSYEVAVDEFDDVRSQLELSPIVVLTTVILESFKQSQSKNKISIDYSKLKKVKDILKDN